MWLNCILNFGKKKSITFFSTEITVLKHTGKQEQSEALVNLKKKKTKNYYPKSDFLKYYKNNENIQSGPASTMVAI